MVSVVLGLLQWAQCPLLGRAWVSESEEATLRTLLVQLWSNCLRWQTGSIVRLAADGAWSEDAHGFHHIAAIQYIVHLELLRNSYFFLNFFFLLEKGEM